MIKELLASVAIREGFLQLMELNERRQIFRLAQAYADSVDKPLLVVGTPKWGFNHPCGDVTIDIQPGLGESCDVEIADVRDIPYPTGYFGAAYCSHVLEHLPTVQDAVIALDEMERVADKVFTVSPHKDSVLARLYAGHYLWITPSGDGYVIEQRRQATQTEEQYWEVDYVR